MHTITMKDQNGHLVDAQVGDTIAAFCPMTMRASVGQIESIKKGFRACGLKITPKPTKCVWLYRKPVFKFAGELRMEAKDLRNNVLATFEDRAFANRLDELANDLTKSY